MEQKKSYPYEGEVFEPSEKKFEEVIIFTHYYGGHKRNLKRHIQLVNALGFRAFVFNLSPQPFNHSFSILLSPRFYISRFGKKWIQEISEVIELFPEKKIFFSFSFSCNIVSILSPQISNLKALVFDGGPFAEPLRNSWLYLSHQEKIHNVFLRALGVFLWIALFDLGVLRFKIKKSLRKLPKHFPILSFQGLEDKLVPPSSIQKLLNSISHLQLTSISLEKTHHLRGLKTQTDIYKKQLQSFLLKVGTPL